MLKKIIKFIIKTILIILTIENYSVRAMSIVLPTFREEPAKIGVLLSNFDDIFMPLVKNGLEEIQSENPDKVQYIFFNGRENQSIQNNDLLALLENKEVNLLLLNLVDQKETKHAIDRIKEDNIPVILFGGADAEAIKSYNKAYWMETDSVENGILQGKLIVDIWNKHKSIIDKNRDGILQYIMLQGPLNNMYAIDRSYYSILTANNASVRTLELTSRECNWSEEESKNATRSLFLRFGNNIEMIIANNDAMAIGAIKALQDYGYNTGNEGMLIPVVGFDAIEEARDLIKKGYMAGTVIQDPKDVADSLYQVGMNILNNKNPLEGTEYTYDFTNGMIVVPLGGIITN